MVALKTGWVHVVYSTCYRASSYRGSADHVGVLADLVTQNLGANMTRDRLQRLIQSLQKPQIFDHPTEGFELVETHISYVLLAGPLAYKFKKPVNFGFLDFTTLEKRRFYCEEELRLNKRLAPELYLEVVAVTGTEDAPRLGGPGSPIEYAVKMRRFPRMAQLDQVLARGELTPGLVEALAQAIAKFHGTPRSLRPTRPMGPLPR